MSDPIAAGSFIPGTERCECCGKKTGYIYSYALATSHDEDYICPWCYQSGSAKPYLKRSICTNTIDDVVSDTVREIIQYQTPKVDLTDFYVWPSHCHDAMSFTEKIKLKEYVKIDYDFCVAAIKAQFSDEALDRINLSELFNNDEQNIFIFKCLHCDHKRGFVGTSEVSSCNNVFPLL
jgi:uncharacterized protein CbrC (UPF0167 family)